MRIGELLVEQRKLRQSELTRALADKPADKRLCSFLITKGLVDFDDAARALGEQKRVPCALSKHLAGRDPSLSKVLPAELGRSSWALPIGRASNGHLIICVRDPAPALLAQLQRATNSDVTMVVTPSSRLENLIREAYGDAPTDEFDVDFSSNVEDHPIPASAPAAPPSRPTPRPQTPAPVASTPPLPDMSALDPESIRLSLTDLDDARVEKDPTQSGQMLMGGRATQPPQNAASTPPHGSSAIALPARAPQARTDPPTQRPRTDPPSRARTDPAATRKMSVSAMQVGLEHATTREAATDLVLAYVATRWQTGLVFAIRDRNAVGYRGHNVIAPESITLPLGAPSTIQHAVDSRFVSVQAPQGPAQDQLSRALEGPEHPAAAPVMVKGQPAAVLVVGDVISSSEDFHVAAADLAMLAEALGTAYQRILGR